VAGRGSDPCANLGGVTTSGPRAGPVRAGGRRFLRRLLVAVFGAAWLAMFLACGPGLAASASPPGVATRSVTTAWQWPLRPVPDEVVHGFDPPDDRWGSGHRGVDLLGAFGEEVHSGGAGLVTYAGLLAGRGVVTVTHGALRTTYEPVTPVVHAGDRVRAGAVIATLDLLAGHCLPRACLHWGLIRGVTYLDPLSVVGAGPVRLLPLQGGVRVAPSPPVPAENSGGKAPARAVSSPNGTTGIRGSPRTGRAARVAVVLAGLGAGATALAARRRGRLRQ
jgi:Peptidase family M23